MNRTAIALATILLTLGCAPAQVVGSSPAPEPSPTAPLAATPEAVATATLEAGPPASHAMANVVAYDFGAQLCSAAWSNNGVNIPCPGDDPANSPDGYVGLYDGVELGMNSGIPIILTYPAQNTFEGIFGRFPGYQVHDGDQFYAHVDCLPAAPCDVEFGLDYYDEHRAYHSGFAALRMHGADPLTEFRVDLSPLAGQVVEPVLVLRPFADRASAYAIWIAPVILSPGTP
jgi:hypothetical protein